MTHYFGSTRHGRDLFRGVGNHRSGCHSVCYHLVVLVQQCRTFRRAELIRSRCGWRCSLSRRAPVLEVGSHAGCLQKVLMSCEGKTCVRLSGCVARGEHFKSLHMRSGCKRADMWSCLLFRAKGSPQSDELKTCAGN